MDFTRRGTTALCILALLAVGVASCKKEKPGPVEGKTLDVKYWPDWIYYSFEKQKTVEVSAPANDKSWDIGFHLSDFRTNGGESGSGMGAAVKTEVTDFETNISLEGLQWETDKTGVGIKTGMMKDPDKSISKNLSLSDKIVWLSGKMPPTLNHSSNVWLIKDAQGRVVKFKVVDFEYERGKKGRKMMLSFDFVYLAN